MAFKDLRDYFDGTCRLPIGGKTYVIQPLNAKDGIWAQAVMDTTVRAALAQQAAQVGGKMPDDLTDEEMGRLNDGEERDFYKTMLGDVYQEMQDDGVDWPSITRAAQTAYLFFTVSEEAAERRWADVEGKALAPAYRRRSGKATGKKSTASSTGTTTSRKRR